MSDVKKLDEKIIAMIGDCQILAAVAEDGKVAKLPTVEMAAYNGGKINVGYWGAVVVDVAGMKASNNTPILYGHNSYSIDAVLGQTSKVTLDNGITASGTFTGDYEDKSTVAGKVLINARNGYKFQVSMGATPLKSREVAEGESVEANGQTFEGPFTLIMESKLNEVSILPLGADDTTSAAIAAGLQTTKEDKIMAKDNEVKTAEDIRAAAVEETGRIQAVSAVAKDHPAIMAQAVKDGWDSTKTEIAVLKAEKAEQAKEIEAAKVQLERPDLGFNIQKPEVVAGAITEETVQAAACLRAGLKNPLESFSAEVLNRAGDIKVRTITEFVKATLALSGKVLDKTRHDSDFIQAAFSTASMANVLGATVNKFVRQGFAAQEQTWREVSRIRSVVDFKANTGVGLVMATNLQTLAPDGEIQHGTISDNARTITADTKALMLAITRKDIINDDLGVLSDLPVKLGNSSARTLNVDFWAALEASVSANYTSGNANTTTGALTTTTMGAAELLYLALQDYDGNPLGVEGSILLCGKTAFGPARELFNSGKMIGGTTKSGDANIYINTFRPVLSKYLATAPWYMTADPSMIALMEVAFLNGNEQPVVESSQMEFNQLGIQMRCVYDYGVAAAEYKGTVYSTGV